MRIMLGITLVGQLCLHLLYGTETFLHSLHFAPLLVVVGAFSTLTRARPVALVLVSFALICLLINNALQFQAALKLFEQYAARL